jgi:hypothetical protein
VLPPAVDPRRRGYAFAPCCARPATGHDKGGVESRGRAVRGARFAAEVPHFLPLPARPFAAAAVHVVPVSRRALAVLAGATYSVPETWAGLRVTAHVGPSTVTLVGPDGRVIHARGRFGSRTIDYRHYLRELSEKPRAVRQVAVPLVRDLGAAFDPAWARLVAVHGTAEAARHVARVLGAVDYDALLGGAA